MSNSDFPDAHAETFPGDDDSPGATHHGANHSGTHSNGTTAHAGEGHQATGVDSAPVSQGTSQNGNTSISTPGNGVPNTQRRPMSKRAKELWRPFLRTIVNKYRVRRMLDSWQKSTGAPCERCASMKLTEEKFIIAEYSKHTRADRLVPRPPPNVGIINALGSHGLEFGPREFELGTLRELYDRRKACPFCSLATTSLREQCMFAIHDLENEVDSEDGFYQSNVTCYISWQIDGRLLVRDNNQNIIGSRHCTRRLRLRWYNRESMSKIGELLDTYIVLVAPRNGGRDLFLGRPLLDVKLDAALIRRWTQHCEGSHGDICNSQKQHTPLSKSFFGVIDVKDMCLTQLPDHEKYIALSYTWGKGPQHFVTTAKNIRDHKKIGGLRMMETMLPRTIRDAINLVRNLDERYLWVDSLCIVQGSDRSWALNSRIMDQVYGNAMLTICAADGDGAKTGLQALSPERSSGLKADRNGEEQSYIKRYSREIRLMSTQPAENSIRKSLWNTRGWTFQERLLSPRNLIFTAGRMYFQCRCTARSADIITEDDSAGWSIEFKDSPLLILQKLPTRPLSVYKKALELYMTRELTQPKDILAAFTGMGNLVCNALGGHLVYGLPSSHFDWALLWEPRDAALARPSSGEEKFPTWSWCGWKGQIMEYKEQMLDGCEENLHDWLMHRTWITWYIRDGSGLLRVVWDGESGTISPQAEATWKGYHLPSNYDEKDHDRFGRYVPPCERKNRIEEATTFKLSLDECPFGTEIVRKSEYMTQSNSTEQDMPYLQFKTWSAFFRIAEDLGHTEELRQDSSSETLFRRYNILDYKEDWCGTILLDKYWVELEGQSPTRNLNTPLEFIALSDAKHFGVGEYDTWANYVPMTREESSWDLYYVMLIETKDDISRRIGLGKVFKEAFENSCRHPKEWKEFILG